jgi:hypothetical protein
MRILRESNWLSIGSSGGILWNGWGRIDRDYFHIMDPTWWRKRSLASETSCFYPKNETVEKKKVKIRITLKTTQCFQKPCFNMMTLNPTFRVCDSCLLAEAWVTGNRTNCSFLLLLWAALNASSQPPDAIYPSRSFLLTILLFARKLCQHWWRKHQLLRVYLTLESESTILQRDVLETRLCHSPENT